MTKRHNAVQMPHASHRLCLIKKSSADIFATLLQNFAQKYKYTPNMCSVKAEMQME